jgi:mono/diheme cytochrome c family protein
MFMRLVFTVLLLICVQMVNGQKNQNAFTTTNIYNEEGKLQMVIAFDPVCMCRTYTEFYHSGKVLAKRKFNVTEKGEYIDGEDLTYSPDGGIKAYKLWKNAVPEGRAYSNFENGKLEHEEFFANKQKTGTWKYYNLKGDLVREEIYVPGKNSWNTKKDWVTKNFYADGKLAYWEIYENGKKIRSSQKGAKGLVANPTEIADGKQLFGLKCSACHNFETDSYGPSLKGVVQKRNKDWLFMMVKNGAELVDSGDKLAVELFNKYRKMRHPSMSKLSNPQIQAIIDYVKSFK